MLHMRDLTISIFPRRYQFRLFKLLTNTNLPIAQGV